jgi:magnesium transporter
MDLLEAYAAAHPDQVARTLETADPEAAATTLLELEPAEAALVLQHVAPPAAARLLERLPSSSGKRLLEELRDDVAAALLRRVPESARADLLAALPTSRRRALDLLLRARPATAAAHVIPSVIALPSEVTAGAAIDRVRAEPQASSHHVYVIDSRHRLIGVVTLGALLRADPGATLRAVMRARPDAVYGHAGVEACVRHPAWRRLSELPVVDRDGVLLGVLHYETLRRMESQLGRGPVAGGVVTTGTALAELYATGLFATTRWAGSLFRAPAMSSRVPDEGGQR